MDPLSIILLVVIIALLGFSLFRGNKQTEDPTMLREIMKENRETLKSLEDKMSRELMEARKMNAHSSQELNSRLDNSAKVIGEVQRELGKMGEANKQLFEVGKDISSLQDILRSPKLRGNFGEILLENLLAQFFPHDRYEMQHTFQSGERADAILKLKDKKMVVIDSKFPLEDFQRLTENIKPEEAERLKKALLTQAKKHVDAISKKYILPAEGTLDFAFMYVPAENVYYELITSDQNLLGYAWEKRIFVVSPNSLCAYFMTVIQGLRALQIEENIQHVQAQIGKLGKELERFGEEYRLVGKHLQNANNSYASSEKSLGKVSSNLTHALEGSSQPPLDLE